MAIAGSKRDEVALKLLADPRLRDYRGVFLQEWGVYSIEHASGASANPAPVLYSRSTPSDLIALDQRSVIVNMGPHVVPPRDLDEIDQEYAHAETRAAMLALFGAAEGLVVNRPSARLWWLMEADRFVLRRALTRFGVEVLPERVVWGRELVDMEADSGAFAAHALEGGIARPMVRVPIMKEMHYSLISPSAPVRQTVDVIAFGQVAHLEISTTDGSIVPRNTDLPPRDDDVGGHACRALALDFAYVSCIDTLKGRAVTTVGLSPPSSLSRKSVDLVARLLADGIISELHARSHD